jgi:ABC-type uncharacterized transport system involved in gliding motility auxiliary subunit
MKRSTLGIGTLVALAVLFVALTMLSNWGLRGMRFDLTQNRLYTIAPGTRHIVEGIKEPVNLYFYFSEKASAQAPALRSYATHVREFLQDLAARSNGKLRLSIVDPLPFSEQEDQAAAYGLHPLPLGGSGDQVYFGLAGTNSTDGKAVIDVFDPAKETQLEYDVAKLIYQLAHPKKPVVGWLSGLPMSGGFDPSTQAMGEPWVVLAQAEQLFDVRQLDKVVNSIAPDVDVLVVAHPKDMPPATLFAIDQFALRGGRVLLLLDPLAEADPGSGDPADPMAAANADRASNFEPLLGAWGVAFDPATAIGDLKFGMTVGMRQGAPPVRHIGILGVDETGTSHTDVVTAALSSLNFASAGFIAPLKGAATKFEPLVQSSAEAGPIPVARFRMLTDPATLRDGFRPTGKRYALAARVTGNVKTAFPQGAPATATLPPGAKVLVASERPLNLIVIADTDVLADFLWVRQQTIFGQRVAQPWANNGDLVWNALDNLAGSGDLISVRGRDTFSRPFGRVEALRRAAEDRYRAKEQELEQQLTQTEAKLTALQGQRNEASGVILTPEQERELERFQGEKLRVRKELRDVRLHLDEDIRALGNRLKIVNIVVVPVLFAGLALLMAFWRRRRRAAIVGLQRDRDRMHAARTAPVADGPGEPAP